MRWNEIVGEHYDDEDGVDHSGEGNFAQELAPELSRLLGAPMEFQDVRSDRHATIAVYSLHYGDTNLNVTMVLSGRPTKPNVYFILGDDGPEVEFGRISRDIHDAAAFARNIHSELERELQGLDYDNM